eukprot:5614586-Alexandrium_andersonii.AAC.1
MVLGLHREQQFVVVFGSSGKQGQGLTGVVGQNGLPFAQAIQACKDSIVPLVPGPLVLYPDKPQRFRQ